MKKCMADFTGLYQISQTLKFELRPIGATEKNLIASGLLEQDRKRAEDYPKVKKFLDEKVEEYRQKFSNPYVAAQYGYIDDVIEPRNTRFRVIRALRTLETKRLANPEKKHSNIPL